MCPWEVGGGRSTNSTYYPILLGLVGLHACGDFPGRWQRYRSLAGIYFPNDLHISVAGRWPMLPSLFVFASLLTSLFHLELSVFGKEHRGRNGVSLLLQRWDSAKRSSQSIEESRKGLGLIPLRRIQFRGTAAMTLSLIFVSVHSQSPSSTRSSLMQRRP